MLDVAQMGRRESENVVDVGRELRYRSHGWDRNARVHLCRDGLERRAGRFGEARGRASGAEDLRESHGRCARGELHDQRGGAGYERLESVSTAPKRRARRPLGVGVTGTGGFWQRLPK